MNSYEPPIKITIPLPSELSKSYGPESTGGYGGNLRVRCTNGEYNLISGQAALLGISRAMFVRSCAIHVARSLAVHRKEQLIDMEAVENGL